jgi:hypothetical protein
MAASGPAVRIETEQQAPAMPLIEAPAGMHHIVIVGGGAAGLELATKAGNKFGKRGTRGGAYITLVDRVRTHLWKPKLHEVARAAWISTCTRWISSRSRTGIISSSVSAR